MGVAMGDVTEVARSALRILAERARLSALVALPASWAAALRAAAALSPLAVLLLASLAWMTLPLFYPEEWKLTIADQFLRVATLATAVLLALVAAAKFLRREIPLLMPQPHRFLLLGIVIAEAATFLYLAATATPRGVEIMWDGKNYADAGLALAARGDLVVDGQPTHHTPPLYPVYLSLFFAVSPTFAAQQVAVAAIFLASMAVVFECTRRLYGASWALLACALVFAVPSFTFPTSRNYAEPLVLITFTAALFAVMRSFEPGKRRWIVAAGVFAGLLYLSKSALGWFFFLGIGMVVVWRIWYAGRGLVRDRWYLLAGLAALAAIVPWMIRNILLFWDGTPSGLASSWQTSAEFDRMWKFSVVGYPDRVVAALPTVAGLAALFLAPFALALSAPLRAAFRLAGREDIGALWMAIVIPVVVMVLVCSVIYVEEITWIKSWEWMNQRSFLHESRYLVIVLVPMVWISALATRLSAGGRR
jgi:hypothetical protein